jgi:hypothetical protein
MLPILLSMSYTQDRLGLLDPVEGGELRAQLLDAADRSGDLSTQALLHTDAGRRAFKAGDP